MAKILLDLMLILISPFMLLGFIFLFIMHLIIASQYWWHPDFPFMFLTLICADLFYFSYLTLFYKRAKSKDGFIQTKQSIMKKEKIYSVIKLADLILARISIYIIPIYILCICIIFIDFVYHLLSMGYESLAIGRIAISICIFSPFIYFWRYLIKKAFRFQSKD